MNNNVDFANTHGGTRRGSPFGAMAVVGGITAIISGALGFVLTQQQSMIFIGATTGFALGVIISGLALPLQKNYARQSDGRKRFR